jgi:hypothetical protein
VPDDPRFRPYSPPSQTRQEAQPRSSARPAERPAQRPAQRPVSGDLTKPVADSAEVKAAAKGSPGLELEEAIVTAGRSGERNITIEKFWVAVDGNLPSGFDVATLPDHGLDVLMEQRAYRKTYTGTGALKTGLTPLAPIGTTGRILVTDVTTGETLEQPWTWKIIGGGGGGLWQTIKRLLWKG